MTIITEWSKVISPHMIKHLMEDAFVPYVDLFKMNKSYIIPEGTKYIFCRPNMEIGSMKWDIQVAQVDHLFIAKELLRIEDDNYVFSRFQSYIYVKINEVRVINE